MHLSPTKPAVPWQVQQQSPIKNGRITGSHEILFEEIQSVYPANGKEQLSSGNSISYLKVTNRFGIPFIVPAEAGPPAFGLWKALPFTQHNLHYRLKEL